MVSDMNEYTYRIQYIFYKFILKIIEYKYVTYKD